MKCPYCGKEIADDALFCRYCGRETAGGSGVGAIGAEVGLAAERGAKSLKTKWVLAAVILVVILDAAAAFYFTQFYERDTVSDAVKSVDLKNSYSLEDDVISLDSVTAQYKDGNAEKIKNYTAYIEGKECEVTNGKLRLPETVSAGECRIRLEWEKDGAIQFCEKTIKVEDKEERESDGGKESGKDTKSANVPEVNTVGNTIGNLTAQGYLAQQGEWLFYSAGQEIYKTKDMNETGEKVCDAVYPANINVVDEWIYYVCYGGGTNGYGQRICRVKTDGTGQEILHQDEDYIYEVVVATTEKIFFQVSPSDDPSTTGAIFSMNPNGSDNFVVNDGQTILHGIENDFLYYTDYGDMNSDSPPELCRMNLKTEEIEIVIEDFVGSNIIVEDEWIYYEHYDDSVEGDKVLVSRLSLEAGNIESIYYIDIMDYEMGSLFAVYDGYLYYIDYPGDRIEETCDIRKIRINYTETDDSPLLVEQDVYDVIYSTPFGVVACGREDDGQQGIDELRLKWTTLD